ncbi:hypothetical protein FHS11_005357 [Mucilaginibacter gotjawali]|uniref:Phosphatidylcholine 1-acylhydrolase n=2 Tax=Mucilaginibacter gotjawali TaxID=1550579 RepID=A0A839SRD5_9SPHI|nr:hypothetical protein [Mucilaginibacter gotjawali]
MIKKITFLFPFYFFYMYTAGASPVKCYLKAMDDSSAFKKADSGLTKARRIKNREFNAIFEQNLAVSSAGQEFFTPKKTLLVADLSPNFVLVNTPKLPFFFVADARINLRLFASHGDPVKSPSYMPGGTLYFRINRDYYNPRFISISYTHHSNGIEGPTSNSNGTINTDSGKFTTNFYTLTYHTGKRLDIGNLIITRYDALGIELHAYLIGLGYTYPLKNKYGFVRINGNWRYNIARANSDPVDPIKKIYSNWQRFDFQFTYIADKIYNYTTLDVKKRLNVSLKYYYQFPFMQNVSFLAGLGYRGQDEYNIFFQNSYAYATFGIAAGLSFNMHPKE